MDTPPICYYYQRGFCRFGPNCWNYHPPTPMPAGSPDEMASADEMAPADEMTASEPVPTPTYNLFGSTPSFTQLLASAAPVQITPPPAEARWASEPTPLPAPRPVRAIPLAEMQLDRVPTPPHQPPQVPDPLPLPPAGYRGGLRTETRETLIKHAKARVSTLVWAGEVFKASVELSTFLVRWHLCDPKTVDNLCISAALESPQAFLTNVLALQ